MTRRSLDPPRRVRIIGGVWRGYRLAVLDESDLRPTPNRVRETLFNWLAPLITSAHCLDLFAGSGALGFEAASRGAARVVLVEKVLKVARQLRENARMLDAQQVEVIHNDARHWLGGQPKPFDLVFLDPPFGEDLLGPCCVALDHGGWLSAGARVYLEASVSKGFAVLPEGWSLTHCKQAGQVLYGLAKTG